MTETPVKKEAPAKKAGGHLSTFLGTACLIAGFLLMVTGRLVRASRNPEVWFFGEVPTAGANGNVNPFALPGGYSITWTGMKVVKHDGSQHHTIGILPTVPCRRTIAGVVSGRDELLEKALEIISRRS